MKQQTEYLIQKAFVQAAQLRYPKLVIFSDTAAHIKKTKIQQIRANCLSSKWKQPDTTILSITSLYGALLIEFKAETPYKKDGVTLKKNDHVLAQYEALKKLQHEGYAVCFCWSVEQALAVLDAYLVNRNILINGTYE